MQRPLGYLALAIAIGCAVASTLVVQLGIPGTVGAVPVALLLEKLLLATAVGAGAYGVYQLLLAFVTHRNVSKRRRHDVRNVLRLVFIAAALVGVLGVVTEQWVGVLFSLGIVGFAVTFALQQPLFSLIGWFYIVVKRPYGVGDRVEIEGSRGDVLSVDFFVTTLWEINGDLVSSHQPSGRVVTLPNSVVLSSTVANYSAGENPYVWNELSVQVAYETDVDFAREAMVEEATQFLGEEMAARVAEYREWLDGTPVEIEVRDKPTVNVAQRETWVELRLRYLVHPRQGSRVRNELYDRILARFNEHPEQVKFPLGRSR